jgi:hypothetical protein
MDNLENPPVAQLDLDQLRAQYNSLHGLVVSTVVLLIVFSMSFNLYLLRQLKFTRAELGAIRPQAQQIIADYQAGSGRAMDEFVKKIAEYGQAHPDFAPILVKYGIKPTPPAAAAPLPITLPAGAAKTKK